MNITTLIKSKCKHKNKISLVIKSSRLYTECLRLTNNSNPNWNTIKWHIKPSIFWLIEAFFISIAPSENRSRPRSKSKSRCLQVPVPTRKSNRTATMSALWNINLTSIWNGFFCWCFLWTQGDTRAVYKCRQISWTHWCVFLKHSTNMNYWIQ